MLESGYICKTSYFCYVFTIAILTQSWMAFGFAGAGLADLALLGKGGEDLPDEIIAHKGGRLVLSCEAGGSPSPTIHWLKNGVRLEQVSETYVLLGLIYILMFD